MEPKFSAPNLSPEQPPASYGSNGERPVSGATPEAARERSAEHFEQPREAAPVAAPVAPVLPSPLVATPPTPMTPNEPTALADDTPVVAADEDLIEKEWVDKAKKIILQTKDDPYRREQEVSKLQADYLRKRYGRELGASQ